MMTTTVEKESCAMCEGLYWSPVVRYENGSESYGIMDRGIKMRQKHKIISEHVQPCPACHPNVKSEYLYANGKKFNQELINKKLIKDKLPKIFTYCFVPDESILLVGKTGAGKTTLAGFWYNSFLAKDKKNIFWTTERELIANIRQKEPGEYLKKIQGSGYVFIDDALESINWQDQSGQNSVTANITQNLYRQLIDYWYRDRTILVFMTSNKKPEEIIEEDHISRRLNEILTRKIFI